MTILVFDDFKINLHTYYIVYLVKSSYRILANLKKWNC